MMYVSLLFLALNSLIRDARCTCAKTWMIIMLITSACTFGTAATGVKAQYAGTSAAHTACHAQDATVGQAMHNLCNITCREGKDTDENDRE